VSVEIRDFRFAVRYEYSDRKAYKGKEGRKRGVKGLKCLQRLEPNILSSQCQVYKVYRGSRVLRNRGESDDEDNRGRRAGKENAANTKGKMKTGQERPVTIVLRQRRERYVRLTKKKKGQRLKWEEKLGHFKQDL